MKYLLLLILIAFNLVICAQGTHNVDLPLQQARQASATSEADSLAGYFSLHYKQETERLYTIYSWVCRNIRYDTDSMYAINAGADSYAKVSVALKRRKGVCENFAAIFSDISNRAGLQVYTIKGYTKQGGFIDRNGHSWCVAKLNNHWLFCDPTWDKDMSSDPRYFLISPSDFIATHMPFDPVWQLLDKPVTHADFRNGMLNAYDGNDKAGAALDSFLVLTPNEQLIASQNRIQENGMPNDLVSNEVKVIKMNLEISYEDKDMEAYNEGVEKMNDATTLFNRFIRFRNDAFTPAKPDAALTAWLNEIGREIKEAGARFDRLKNSKASLKLDAADALYHLEKLNCRLKQQENFVQQYLSANAAERASLFYH